MPTGARQARNTAADKEIAEIEALSARVIEEAPEPGANLLDTAESEISVQHTSYGRARRFADLAISQRTLAGLAKGKWQKMTDIQRAAIPHALAGRDVLGAAKTGSGKTLAFLVPMLERLYRERWGRLDGLGALVISPTRELAMQIFDVLRIAGHRHDLSAGLVIGGKDKGEEAERVRGMNVLVCTPGRLLQHFDETAGFEANNLKLLILDEADRILDMGFRQALSAILAGLPKERQTLLFSATQTKDVKALARLSLRQPQYVGVHEKSSSSTPARLEHHCMTVRAEAKLDVLFGFVRSHLQAKVIVFLSSCKQVQFVHAAFSALRPGVPLLCLHGRQKQMKRLAVYTDFCAKKHATLFTTDVAARGLDFPQVQWVVQADCPEDVAAYIHRTGRTARHNASGRALLLLLASEAKMLEMLDASRVKMQKLSPNAKHIHSLKPRLQSLLAERSELKYTAQRAFVSYVRSVSLQADKSVFDAKELPLDLLAESMGLLAAPRIRFLSASKGKTEGKNWAASAAATAEVPPRARKIKIRKGGTVAGGKRTVFDDQGVPMEERLGGGSFAEIVSEKRAASGDGGMNSEARVAAVRASLKAAAESDKQRERERVRGKHKDQKRKRKAAEEEASGRSGGGAPMLAAAEEDDEGGWAEGGSDDGDAGAMEEDGAIHLQERPRRKKRKALAAASTEESEVEPRDLQRKAEEKLAKLLGGGR